MKKTKKKSVTNSDFVPSKEWPGAFKIYRLSQSVISFNLQNFLLLIICAYIADIAAALTKQIPIRILLYIIAFLFVQSMLVLLVSSVKKEKLTFSEALDKGTRLSLRLIALYVIVGLGILVSFVLLVVPVYFVLPRLILAPYYLIDQDMSISLSLKTAWKNAAGHELKTWGIIGVEVLFGFLSLILIGIYLSIAYSAAFIILYFYTKDQSKTTKK